MKTKEYWFATGYSNRDWDLWGPRGGFTGWKYS